MAEVEEQTFRVIQFNGPVRNDLGEMTGQSLYGFIRTRADEAIAEAMLSDLERNGTACVRYKDSYGQAVRVEIKQVPPSEVRATKDNGW